MDYSSDSIRYQYLRFNKTGYRGRRHNFGDENDVDNARSVVICDVDLGTDNFNRVNNNGLLTVSSEQLWKNTELWNVVVS